MVPTSIGLLRTFTMSQNNNCADVGLLVFQDEGGTASRLTDREPLPCFIA